MSASQRWWINVLVISNALISSLHGLAHEFVSVYLDLPGYIFLTLTVYLLPFYGLWRLRKGAASSGLGVVFISLAGALLFGLYKHYIEVSADHVHHVPGKETERLFFQITAHLVLIFGVIGTGYSAWLLGSRQEKLHE